MMLILYASFSHRVYLAIMIWSSLLVSGCNLFTGNVACEDPNDCKDGFVCDYTNSTCVQGCSLDNDCYDDQKCVFQYADADASEIEIIERSCMDENSSLVDDCDGNSFTEYACDLGDSDNSNCNRLIGDGICDNGNRGVNLNCEMHDYDLGDCWDTLCMSPQTNTWTFWTKSTKHDCEDVRN